MSVTEQHSLEVGREHVRSLRGMIEWLRATDCLLETEAPVDPDLEITGVQKHLDGSYPFLFKNVKGYPHLECVTNLYAKMTSSMTYSVGKIPRSAHANWHMRSRIPFRPSRCLRPQHLARKPS